MQSINYFGTEKMSLSGFCDFCKKNSPLIISVTFGLFFAYGIKLVFYSIGIDTEMFAANKPSFLKWNVQIGRFGLGLIQRLWYIHEFNPLSSFFVAFCFIWLFTISWCYCLAVFSKNTGRNNKLIPFALLFMTTPVWAEQFYFVFQSAETAYMIFLCPYVIYLLDLFKNHLNHPVIVYDTTNQCHSQRMSVVVMPPVWIVHTFKCFYPAIDMFNDNSPA